MLIYPCKKHDHIGELTAYSWGKPIRTLVIVCKKEGNIFSSGSCGIYIAVFPGRMFTLAARFFSITDLIKKKGREKQLADIKRGKKKV